MTKDFFTYKQLGGEKDDKPSNVKKPGDVGALPTTTPKETIIVGVESGKVDPNKKPPTYTPPTYTLPTVTEPKPQKYSDALHDYTGKFETLYNDLYKEIKEYDPLASDWAKTLMSYYGIEGDAAANSARASGAADNAGNVDSYAAANAERQRLSKLNAGISAISGMSNERFANMLSTLEGLGANVISLFGLEGQYDPPTTQGNTYTTESVGTPTIATLDKDTAIARLRGLYGGGLFGDSDYMTDEETWKKVLDLMTSGTEYSNDRAYFAQLIKEIIAEDLAKSEGKNAKTGNMPLTT